MSTILLFNASNSSRSIHQNLLNAIAPLLSTHKLCYASSLDFDLPFIVKMRKTSKVIHKQQKILWHSYTNMTPLF